MSRRRSRFTPTTNLDHELTVDEFLMGLVRTPRTLRNNHRHPVDAHKNSVPSLAQHEAKKTLLKTLSTIGSGEAKNNSAKPRKGKIAQIIEPDDIELNTLVGDKASKKKRRKHYVVYNSLPLSRCSQSDEFQFPNGKLQPCGRSEPINTRSPEENHWERGIPAMGLSSKPLYPVDIIRGVIPQELAASSRVLKEGADYAAVPKGLIRMRPRSKPGGGFDCIDESFLVGSEPVLPLKSMPKASSDQQLSLGIAKALGDRSGPSYIMPKPQTKEYMVNDCETYSERSLMLQFRSPNSGVEIIPAKLMFGGMSEGVSATSTALNLGVLGPKFLVQGAKEPFDGIDMGNCSYSGYLKAPQNMVSGRDLTDIKGVNPKFCNTSQKQSTAQEVSPLNIRDATKDRSKQNRGLATETITVNWRSDHRISRGNAPEGFETLSKKERCRIPASCILKDIETDKNPYPITTGCVGLSLGNCILGRNGLSLEGSSRKPLASGSSLNRVGSGLGGHRLQVGRTPMDEDEESSYLVSQPSFTNNPGRSYFSTAQLFLEKKNDDASFESPGHLSRSILTNHRSSTINGAIDEVQQVLWSSVSGSNTSADTHHTARIVLPKPKYVPTIPVSLKDLLNRAGKRRPSVSGIFRGKKYSDAKPINQGIQGSGDLVLGKKVDYSLLLASDAISSLDTSNPPDTYKSKEVGSKIHRPYLSPLREKSPVLKKSKQDGSLARRLGPRVTMNTKINTGFSLRQVFKPPSLKQGARKLLDSRLIEETYKKLQGNTPDEQIELGSVVESQSIDIKRISSFRAVHEAW